MALPKKALKAMTDMVIFEGDKVAKEYRGEYSRIRAEAETIFQGAPLIVSAPISDFLLAAIEALNETVK